MIDIILCGVLTFFPAFAVFYRLIGNAYLSFGIAVAAAALTMLSIPLVKRRFKSAPPPFYEICRAFALSGHENTTKAFAASLPASVLERFATRCIIVNLTSGRELWFINFKFASTNEEDAAAAFRFAKEENIRLVKVIGSDAPRSVRILCASIPDIRFYFLGKKEIKEYIKNHNIIPPLLLRGVKISLKKESFSALIALATRKERIKYYFFAGITLFLISFITPLRVYYTVLAVIPLVLALICAVKASLSNR